MRLIFSFVALLFAGTADYRASVEKWRADRETRLKAEDGWLTLVGLAWLDEGANAVGSAEGSRVQLPDGPAHAGAMERKGQQVWWAPSGGRRVQLTTDASGSPDVVQVGRLKLHVIQRGSKLGVRVKDNESEYRRNFQGLRWFPIREEWRVTARFVAHPAPRKLVFDAQAGDKQEYATPGYAEWEYQGRKLRLTPVTEGNELFWVFRDRTAGKSTYAAARFLYTDLPKNGTVVLDFNKAYNPPCVFTPYATCPLPPPENRLPVAVEAGEMMYDGH